MSGCCLWNLELRTYHEAVHPAWVCWGSAGGSVIRGPRLAGFVGSLLVNLLYLSLVVLVFSPWSQWGCCISTFLPLSASLSFLRPFHLISFPQFPFSVHSEYSHSRPLSVLLPPPATLGRSLSFFF